MSEQPEIPMADVIEPKNYPGKHPGLIPTTSRAAIASLVLGVSSVFCAFFTGIAAIIFGVVALTKISKSNGRLSGQGLAIAGLVTGVLGCMWTLILIGMLLPAVQQVRVVARRATSMNDMRELTLGMLNYESAHMHYPPSEVPDGRFPFSWRVEILPFIGEHNLHDQFRFNEPWDSPHNLSLVEQMPDVFKSPNVDVIPGRTVYQIPVTDRDLMSSPDQPTSAFIKGESGPGFGRFVDGASNTIVILEVDAEAAQVWTDPAGDWSYDPDDPLRSLGGNSHNMIILTNADGSASSLSKRISPADFRARLTINGGEAVTNF